MKNGIHPEAREVAFVERSSGFVLIAKSTAKTTDTYEHEGKQYPSIFIEVSSASHPHYTGEERILKTGAVDKFYARMQKTKNINKK